MNSAEFTRALAAKFLAVSSRDTYRAALADEELNDFMRDDLGPEFQSMIDLHGELDDSQREKLFASLDLAVADTIATLLGIIDGSSHLPGFEGEFDLRFDGQKIEGELQSAFLEAVNHPPES
jgi:hypothetical protein